MAPLAPELRRDLDRAVGNARTLAESGARAAIARLGVEVEPPPSGLSADLRDLRIQLRARLRAIGKQALVEEIAYEQWHRMLFARFLAENGLLLHPEGAQVSLEEVKELATEEGGRDPWVLAARYAAAMLPGIFGADDPANRVSFAPEDRSRLEGVLEGLPDSLFTADDTLGWVYQFWQSQRKDEVNKKGDKIGGADLPPVTQLFTEHYMVRFLLENSLGAWWAGRHPDSPLLGEWEYLRFGDDGTPAAGTFEGWPARAAEVTVMDPCCGSGHFLVAAADMLRKMRVEEEGITPAQAAVAVIEDNLFGLELDARCLQLAAFNLALDTWKVGGYQPLPIPNLACSGIAIRGQRADWHRLAGEDRNMRHALDRLYNLFQDASELGSLIDPRSAAGDGLWKVDTDELLDKLDQALARETAADPAAAVFGAAAVGTARAARLLSARYWLVATNPPFLGFKRMSTALAQHTSAASTAFRYDLATAFLRSSLQRNRAGGTSFMVTPQNWLFLSSYQAARREVLSSFSLRLVASLGPRAFDSISGEVVKVVLAGVERSTPLPSDTISFVDVTAGADAATKAGLLRTSLLSSAQQSNQLGHPDSRIALGIDSGLQMLSEFADGLSGVQSGDRSRFVRRVWEVYTGAAWVRFQGTVAETCEFGGREYALLWEGGRGRLETFARANRARLHDSHRRGTTAWGRQGVAVSLVSLASTRYTGDAFDNNTGVVMPRSVELVAPVWAFVSSPDYRVAVRRIDKKLNVTNATLVKVPFDLEHWQKVAAAKHPDGLPEPHSDDPTQWLFKGRVVGSEAPLQVAVGRLLGYRWPDQEPDALDDLTDADGLVPLPSVGGERSAADRLRELLAGAYGDTRSPALLDRLLVEAGSPGATLETWLRDDFFAQHTKVFQHRPFIWHVWDGRKDGFSVLCHYHRLDRARLEKVTYTLLGDWIERQRAASGEPGAEARLVAALGLQDRLKLIIEGEKPYDIYVRWKSLAEQPIGWEPDLDDGVRLNIRPFVAADVLRAQVNVKWDKDRGRDPDGSERINDLHPTLAQKRAARAAMGRG